MPFCPEGFIPEPPLSRVVIAPDMTAPIIEIERKPRPSNYRTRYSAVEIRLIRAARERGIKLTTLADQWDTTPTAISRICRGLTYAHVGVV